MNKHIFLDKLTVNLAAKATKNFRFFDDSLDSPTLKMHIDNVSLHLTKLNGVGQYEVSAESLVGPLDAAFMIAQWKGDEYPTILYHHGNNERPFDMGAASKNSFKNIFLNGKNTFPANLIASARTVSYRFAGVHARSSPAGSLCSHAGGLCALGGSAGAGVRDQTGSAVIRSGYEPGWLGNQPA
jgi:hypothetical protein